MRQPEAGNCADNADSIDIEPPEQLAVVVEVPGGDFLGAVYGVHPLAGRVMVLLFDMSNETTYNLNNFDESVRQD